MACSDKGFLSLLSGIRRAIHMRPELGFEEANTSAYIIKLLNKWGIKTKRLGRTGVSGLLKGASSSGCIAVRADMDALPVKTQLKKTYASRNCGIMHACGHDANTAIVLGCAYLLSRKRNLLKKDVKFIFQPAEETSDGALSMIKRGVLKNPRVDVILGAHVNPELKLGQIGLKEGELMSAVDKFSVAVYGGGGHGAYPHLGKDALLAAARIIVELQTVISRFKDPLQPAVLSVCRIYGGDRFNVLADRVEFEGTVRTLDEKLRKSIPVRIKRIVSAMASIYGLKAGVNYVSLGSVLVNNPLVVAKIRSIVKKHCKSYQIKDLKKPSMGGEDFAEYLDKVKGCFIYFGSSSSRETSYPWHHPCFDIDERVLEIGANVLAESVEKIKI